MNDFAVGLCLYEAIGKIRPVKAEHYVSGTEERAIGRRQKDISGPSVQSVLRWEACSMS